MKVQSNILKVTVSLILFAASQAMAVPQLRVTAADFDQNMATIYPDSIDPNLYYFLPNTGGIARNPDPKDPYPLIGLTFEDLDSPNPEEGDGMMNGVLETGITPELRAELKSFQSRHPGSKLTVIPFGDSYLTLGLSVANLKPDAPAVLKYAPDPAPAGGDMAKAVATQVPPQDALSISPTAVSRPSMPKGYSRYFEDFVLPPHAGVAETRVGFNSVLSKRGAIMFKAALSGLNPLNLFLCYGVFGALPTMEATITMKYDRIYSYFQAAASGGWGFWGWSVAAVVEKLIESGDIVITITGANDKQEDYVWAVAKDLANTYLKPVLTAAPGASGTTGFGFNQYSVNSTYKEERKTVSWKLKEQKYITDDRCNAMPISDLRPYLDRIIINAKPGGQR